MSIGRRTDTVADGADGDRAADGADGRRPPALAATNLTKRYGDGDSAVEALSDVTFAVEPGSIVGLLGANGAGKTTLLKSLLGLVLPSDGTVAIDGTDVFDDSSNVHGAVAAVFEGARNVYWRLTARENVAFFARLHGVPRHERPRSVGRALESVGLETDAEAPVRDLSRGMKQRCALACSLVQDASVLLLDEPTLGLDHASKADLLDVLGDLAGDERTILVSSHDMDVVETVCDRVVVLDRGRVVRDASVAELKEAFATRSCSITLDRALTPEQTTRIEDAFDTSGWMRTRDRTRFEVAIPDSGSIYAIVAALEADDLPLRAVERTEPDLGSIFTSIADPAERSITDPPERSTEGRE